MVRFLRSFFISAAAMQAAHGVRIPSKSQGAKDSTAFQQQKSEHDDMAQAQACGPALVSPAGVATHETPMVPGIQAWEDRTYPIVAPIPSEMQGTQYFRLARTKEGYTGTQLGFSGMTNATLFACSEQTRDRDCGYAHSLPNLGFAAMAEEAFWELNGANPLRCYKKFIASSDYVLPTITTSECVQIVAVKCPQAPTPPPTPCPTPPPPTPFPTAPPPTTQAPTPAPDDLCRRAFAAKCYEEDLYKQCCTVEQCAANDNWHVCGWAISLGPDRIASSYRYPDDSEALTCFEACQLFKISRPASDYCPGGMLERELEEKGCRLSVLSLHEQRTANKPVFDQYCGADVESSAIQSLAFVKGYSHSQESSQTRALHNTSDADLCRSAWDAGCYHDTATFAPCCPEPVCIHGGSVMTCDWTGFENMKGTFEFSSLDRSCFDSCAALSGDLPAIDFCIGGPISSTLAATGCRAAQDSFQGQQSEHEMALSPYCGGE